MFRQCRFFFFFFFTLCYRAFLWLIKHSVCAAVLVLYNTLVTSYIFWAHRIKEYCAKNVPVSGLNETVPHVTCWQQNLSRYLNSARKDTFVFLVMSKLWHESGLLLIYRGSYTDNAISVALTCFVKLQYLQYMLPVPLQLGLIYILGREDIYWFIWQRNSF